MLNKIADQYRRPVYRFAAGGKVSDAEIQNWMAANKGADDKTIAAAMQQYGVSTGQLSSAMGYNPQEVEQRYAVATAPASPGFTNYSQAEIGNYLANNPNVNIAAATQQFNADPRAVNQYISQLGEGFIDPTQTTRGSGSGQYYDAFSRAGIDANELYLANKALNPDYSFSGDTSATGLSRAFETAQNFKGFDPQGETQLIKDTEWVKQMDATGSNAFDIARLTGLSIGEVEAREAAARAAMKKPKVETFTNPPTNVVVPIPSYPNFIAPPVTGPKLPFTSPDGTTIYPNSIQTPQGPMPTYFPTSWWTSSPSASKAYGQTTPSTARNFNAEMEAYRAKYAPVFTRPTPPPMIPVATTPNASAAPDPTKPPTENPGVGMEWKWNGSSWVAQPIQQSYARGGEVNELWKKYHGR
jgi:hypothetical protein